MAAGALVIAIASSQGSAPRGDVLTAWIKASSAGALREQHAGAERSGAAAKERAIRDAWEARNAEGGVAQSAQVTTQSVTAAPDYTATATPWLVEAGREADYAEGGDADGSSARSNPQTRKLSLDVTRRACAARRGLATICAAVSERAAGGTGVAPLRTSTRSETCRSARRGLAFYRSRFVIHVQRRIGNQKPVITGRKPRSCADARYLAARAKAKAHAARGEFERWHRYHYAWREWLPDRWQRIGACETGYGRRPGNWRWDSGTYQGAFGFYYGSWDAFVPLAARKARPYPSEAYLATPRQQYEVALAIWRRYGFSGWGCRGA